MLTTVDNPYDPFTQFDKWFQYDNLHGYSTCCYLARVAALYGLSDDRGKTDEQIMKENEFVIDRILSSDIFAIYAKAIKGQKNAEFD